MNDNIDLTKILKDCPEGTKLYSTIFGDVTFYCIDKIAEYPIILTSEIVSRCSVSANGKYFVEFGGECTLFPSKDQRDWSKFNPKQPKQTKFNPNTLNPFDEVLARNDREDWSCVFFSHIVKDEETYPYACGYDWFTQCIPYNDDTKHLVGTSEEAPEFYRHWED